MITYFEYEDRIEAHYYRNTMIEGPQLDEIKSFSNSDENIKIKYKIIQLLEQLNIGDIYTDIEDIKINIQTENILITVPIFLYKAGYLTYIILESNENISMEESLKEKQYTLLIEIIGEIKMKYYEELKENIYNQLI
jgi:hydrogenase maturation factor HypE